MPLPRNIRKRSEKYDQNISKRGNVPIGKASDHLEENQPVNRVLVTFFLIVVVGSSIVQIFRLFQQSPSIDE